MQVALVVLAGVSGLELLLWMEWPWKQRKPLAKLLFVFVGAASLALAIVHPSFWTILIGLLSAYRCLNLARIAANRMQADYLFRVSRQTSQWLIGAQVVIVCVAGLAGHFQFTLKPWLSLVAAFEVICGAALLASTLRHVRTTRPPLIKKDASVARLPTLTVAIPARNETTDLEDCLESLLSSNYPKLEIVVLDDCSQNKRTPEIIRGYAHDGVRFIAGQIPPDEWLAKNHAYAQLAAAANGELLLFCGVDVRFEPGSLETLVRTLLQKQKRMLSVMPRNLRPKSRSLRGWFMQPNRYAWELSLPRRLVGRPPVLSTCWLIGKDTLEASGGFQAIRRKAVPEAYFARAAAASGDGYSFMQSDERVGISCRKDIDEQRATSIRTRYLQLHRRPELALATSLAEFFVLVGPFILFVGAGLSRAWILTVAAAVSLMCNIVVYAILFNLTYRRFLLKGLWLLPLAAVYDIWLLNYSMWQYEFREVLWKGRNVCIPVMRILPELPKIT